MQKGEANQKQQLSDYTHGDGVKAGDVRGQGQGFLEQKQDGTGTGSLYNERIYTVVWLNNLQPAEMELMSQCN